ncbi:MAG: shikimate kinase [Spirochaetota bacterium]
MDGLGKSPLVITGFMGSGKTSTGKAVARRLGCDFMDMDAAIEKAEGMPISRIFEKQGEAYFRLRESELCVRLATRKNLVVSTGGGVFVNPANRELFKDALVVCLDADSREVYNRLRNDGRRPLLTTADPYQQIVELMEARRSAYAHVEWHIDTKGKTVDEVADEIVVVLRAGAWPA